VWGYSAREVAKMLDLSPAQVRSYVRSGFLAPARGSRGEMRFSFQDLVLLRTAKGLLAAHVPTRRVRRALIRLREQLPEGRPLSGVHITAEQGRVVVRDGAAAWQPESGQVLFDFDVADLAREVAPLARRAVENAPAEGTAALDADDWYAWGCELDEVAPEEASAAYRRALELDPTHVDALINLGRLLHEAGQVGAAEAHYRRARARRPDDATACFNHGVALEDLGRLADAIAAYERALACDPDYVDAHYNLARLYERLGRQTAAIRHLKAYRQLTR